MGPGAWVKPQSSTFPMALHWLPGHRRGSMSRLKRSLVLVLKVRDCLPSRSTGDLDSAWSSCKPKARVLPDPSDLRVEVPPLPGLEVLPAPRVRCFRHSRVIHEGPWSGGLMKTRIGQGFTSSRFMAGVKRTPQGLPPVMPVPLSSLCHPPMEL